jgi:hypothetical protein
MTGVSRFLIFSAAAGATVLVMLAAIRKERSNARRDKVGEHAWLVPMSQARREADWTGRAFVHSSESHHKG